MAAQRNGVAIEAKPPHRSRRAYRRSGFYAMKRTNLLRRTIDHRTATGRMLATLKADLVRDLGGDVSVQQATIIDLAVKQRLLLDSIDAWLLTQASLVDVEKRALIPVVRDRQYVADALARYLSMLGLDRKAAPVEDLDAYLIRRAAERESATTTTATELVESMPEPPASG